MQNFKNHTNFGKLYLGCIFISLGFIYLLDQLNIYTTTFQFRISDVLPVIIIAFGLSLLDLKRTSSMVLGTLSTIALVVITVLYIMNNSSYGYNDYFGNGRYNMMNRYFNTSNMPCKSFFFDTQNFDGF